MQPHPDFAPRTAQVTFRRDGRGPYSLALTGPAPVARLVRSLAAKVEGEPREHFFVVLLDVRHRVLGVYLASIGGLASAPVDPRAIFLAAVAAGAIAIVVAHNHPSGDATPSPEDHAVTERLAAAGAVLGIQVLDHLVIGEREAHSIAGGQRIPF